MRSAGVPQERSVRVLYSAERELTSSWL